MKIDTINIFKIFIPFNEPFRFGNVVQPGRDHIIVSMCSGKMTKWGEAGLLRWPYYNSEIASGAFHVIKEVLAPS